MAQQLFSGNAQILGEIVGFAEGYRTERTHAALRVWRTLSRQERRASEAAARLPSVADHIFLRFEAPEAAYTKLSFYTQALMVPVTGLTINDPWKSLTGFVLKRFMQLLVKPGAANRAPDLEYVNFTGCWSLTDSAAELLADCPLLQNVNFTFCRSLTDTAALHLSRCAHLQCVNFENCRNITDVAAAYLSHCPQLQCVSFQSCPNLLLISTSFNDFINFNS